MGGDILAEMKSLYKKGLRDREEHECRFPLQRCLARVSVRLCE